MTTSIAFSDDRHKPKPKPEYIPELKPKLGFARNLVHQRENLYGMIYMECYFCGSKKSFKTPITFDMELHMYEYHRLQLFQFTSIDGKSSPPETELTHLITKMKVEGRLNKQYFGPECFTE